MALTLPDETRAALVASFKAYFRDEREEEIGDLQAGLLLDFVVAEVGPSLYNQGVRDARARVEALAADLDATLHEPELGYTAALRTRRNARR